MQHTVVTNQQAAAEIAEERSIDVAGEPVLNGSSRSCYSTRRVQGSVGPAQDICQDWDGTEVLGDQRIEDLTRDITTAGRLGNEISQRGARQTLIKRDPSRMRNEQPLPEGQIRSNFATEKPAQICTVCDRSSPACEDLSACLYWYLFQVRACLTSHV